MSGRNRSMSRRNMLASSAGAAGAVMLGGAATHFTAAESKTDNDGWIQLFDGKSLEGWHTNPEKIGHGTGGHWHVEPGGVLAGEQDPPGSGNGGILLTDRKFENFELEVDIKPSWGVDSGIFLRSTESGQCLQMTVDYYNGGNIGHFYGEAIGGWVARAFSIQGVEEDGKLVRLEAINERPVEKVGMVSSCKAAEWLETWKIDDWNTIFIRVEGGRFPTVSTMLNGLEVGVFNAATSNAEAYNRDDMAKLLDVEGHIAVQVHGGGKYPVGDKCRWRNIRVREL